MSDRCSYWSSFQLQACHSIIAEGCLHYLLYLGGPESFNLGNDYGCHLSEYAAEFWWQHAQQIDGMKNNNVTNLTLRLLLQENNLLAWAKRSEIDWIGRVVPDYTRACDLTSPLYFAAWTGLSEVVREIVQQRVDVNCQGERYGNPLQIASFKVHENIVQQLLDTGADVNAQQGRYGTALQAALATGHEDVVKMLACAGADYSLDGGEFGNVLQAASYGGQEEIVQILLKNGMDVNIGGGEHGSALKAASCRGWVNIAQMLLDEGADVNALGGQKGTALNAASTMGMNMWCKSCSMLKQTSIFR